MIDENFLRQEGSFVDYRVRVSGRVRNVRLTLSAQDGLVVVVPPHFDADRIPGVLDAKRGWIEGHLRRLAEMPSVRETASAVVLPDAMELPALGESWRVIYRTMNTERVGIISESSGVLTVYGAVHDVLSCREALCNWLKRRTREELCPLLSALAVEHGFRFRESAVRGQKTRWGSCSAQGTISISFKLLFLERDWVRCVLLHELCHTVFMNHSASFRELLHRIEPQCAQIDKAMRDAGRRVPAWADNR
jgi:predicted metal-dependent hydrolase